MSERNHKTVQTYLSYEHDKYNWLTIDLESTACVVLSIISLYIKPNTHNTFISFYRNLSVYIFSHASPEVVLRNKNIIELNIIELNLLLGNTWVKMI